MKKPWLAPVVICAALLLAWPLRWERGPTQQYQGYTVYHLHDRWTGDNWVYRYSIYGVNVTLAPNSEGWLINIPKPGVLAQKKLLEQQSGGWKTDKIIELEAKGYIRLLTAYGRRNLATGIWVVLVLISGAWAWRLYRRQGQQESLPGQVE